jgi:cell wall-associated NlpC family hydrolase
VASSSTMFSAGRRTLLSAVGGLASVALIVGLAPGVQAAPKPTIASVTTELKSLASQNERLSEQYNKAGIEVAAKQKQANRAATTATKARNLYLASSRQVRLEIVQQYKGGGLSRASALLTSNSSQNYLDQLSTMSLMSTRRITITAQLKTEKVAATKAAATATALLAQANKNRKALGLARAHLTAQVATYTKLLSRLNAAQRAKLLMISQTKNKAIAQAPVTSAQRRAQIAIAKSAPTSSSKSSSSKSSSSSTPGPAPAPSARAGIAINFALAQIGKPYVFAASGPRAFDCSGLTMAAWGKAGVSLPHLAAAQYNRGHHVSRSQLEPGDLVFFYGLGHVALYIGRGLVVHAPHTGDVVRIAPLSHFGSAYVGAVRLT